MFFSRNTREETRQSIIFVVGVQSTNQYEKYLGLPALVGRSRISSFNGIKGRIWSHINEWKEKFLTHAGKEILIKIVLQAIPTYTMSVFRIPKTLIRDINSMLSRFWWSFKENTHKITWMDWKGLGRKKEMGGMGFRELECFNMALLAKQG